ncbi:MAG: hypothetical protein KC474_12250, partial [Cyanobacteria bacterium HKST-UBA04]|nr:hypothetical protein [Cyanobacteria bacterium HKST-UBA04]
MDEKDVRLTVTLENKMPMELSDMTLSLLALSSSYNRFVKTSGPRVKSGGRLKLYVKEVRAGSAIVDIFSSPESSMLAYYSAIAA